MNRSMIRRRVVTVGGLLACAVAVLVDAHGDDVAVPASTDDRLMMELVAQQPELVTPTGVDVDDAGRVFVAESHTHFRPDEYDGPAKDRILVFDDTNADGRLDRRRVFHEGFTHVMDIEFDRDGSLYVATRMDIHRLRDTDGDLLADDVKPVVRMETGGTYPHNGLSGLAFDFAGRLNFGLGENLGHEYTLVGSDGIRIGGGGEGGSTYLVEADGSKLRRVTTGWWNPWGMCVDEYGRVFGVDNDPGASPPCRLIQVVEHADYGYEYRYGRSGLHPLITWTGDIRGTLPMVAGTGEAPCAVIAYDSDALPDDYHGDLLVASWADHRIERYQIRQPSGSGLVATQREVLFQGDDDFRPVGLGTAPDGTIYVSDWVSSSYTLHRLGRLWRIRPSQPRSTGRSDDPAEALQAADRVTRQRGAGELVRTDAGRQILRQQMLRHRRSWVRATCIMALATAADSKAEFAHVARHDPLIANRVLAIRALLAAGADAPAWSHQDLPAAVRAEAVARLDPARHQPSLRSALTSPDVVVYHAALSAYARRAQSDMQPLEALQSINPEAYLLAAKRNPVSRKKVADHLASFISHPDAGVRFAAIKWVADDQLKQYRGQVAATLNQPGLTYRLFLATAAALDRLDDKDPADRPPAARLLSIIDDASKPATIRALSLRLIDPGIPALTVDTLVALIGDDDQSIRREAIRTLIEHPSDERLGHLRSMAEDQQIRPQLRAWAVAGLAADAAASRELLLRLATQQRPPIRDEALRSLVGVELSQPERTALLALAATDARAAEAIDRLVSPESVIRPAAADVAAWQGLLSSTGDAAEGERVFFGTKIGTCSNCHQYDGRGKSVGPALSLVARRLATQGAPREWLLETILQPSREIAPQYSTWIIITTDGRTLTGLPRRKGGGSEAYLGMDGKEFSVRKQDIEEHAETGKSIMPDGLLNTLTTKELQDLFAFLQQAER